MVAAGVILTIPFSVCILLSTLVVQWKLDAWRGYRCEVQAGTRAPAVTLVHEPGFDFYETWFRVEDDKGRSTSLMIDCDDYRRFFFRTKEKEGRIYFVSGLGRITDRTSYVDPEKRLVFAGYLRRTISLDDLDFSKEWQ